MASAEAATKQDLLDAETRLKGDISNLETQLKGDISSLEIRLKAEMTEMRGEMTEMRQEILDGVQEMVRDAQTEILKAFLPYQETQSVRFQALEMKITNTDAELTARMAVLERRLWEIEKRLLMNPPAA